jgi:DNA-binding transcriptional LysR family regulator
MQHDLQSLKLFVALCETKSLTRAAAMMNIAISAASRRIKLLEREAGEELVRRLPHGVEPTLSGLTALRYARSVLRLSDQFAAHMAEHRSGVRGRVRVFASSSALVQRLADDLAHFALQNPDITIDLEERPSSDTLEALHRKQADVGVIVRGAPMHGITAYPYTKDRLGIAMPAGHALADRPSLAFAEILDEDLVSTDESSAIYRLLVEQANAKGRFLRLRVKVRSFEVMCQMVRRGLGIGVLPEESLRPLVEALGLVLVPLEETWAARDFDICIPANEELDPPAARLVSLLRALPG